MVVGFAVSVLAACGGDAGPLPLDSAPPEPTTTEIAETTSTAAATTTTSSPVIPSDQIGDEWTLAIGNLAGLPSECGNLGVLTAWPGRDVLVAGIHQQGLWQSVDGGAQWTQLGTGEDSAEIVNLPTSIVFDPDNGDRFWQSGLWHSGSVYRTDDSGTHFAQLGDVDYGSYLAVDYSDPERRTLLLSLVGSNEVVRSSDGGQTWADITGNLPFELGDIQAPLIVDAQTYLVGSIAGPLAGVFRTVDGGQTWTQVHDGDVSGPPVTVGESIYWLLASSAGVIVSHDGGATWEVADGGGVAFNSRSLVVLPDGRLATLGERRVLISSDGGESWRPVGPAYPFPFLPTGLVYAPAREAFYIWRNECDRFTDNAVADDAIQALTFVPAVST